MRGKNEVAASPYQLAMQVVDLLIIRSQPLAIVPNRKVARQAVADYRAAWRRIDGWAPRRSTT